MAELVQYYGTGRRKSSVARVFLRPGSGKLTVNGREFDKYFLTGAQRVEVKQPLVTSETSSTFDITANVSGGGINGQAGALKMGIARALLEFNIELRKKLKQKASFPATPAAKSAKNMDKREPASASSSPSANFTAGRQGPSSVFVHQSFQVCLPVRGSEGGAERLITGTKNLPSRIHGSGAGNKSRAGRMCRRGCNS